MKKMTLLAASIALVLAGCGSSSDDNDNGATKPETTPLIPLVPADPVEPEEEEKPEPTTFTVKAIDGYLAYADVYRATGAACADTLTPADAAYVGTTDKDGALELPLTMQDAALCVVAESGQTIDKDRGVVTADFVLSAPAGSSVISPFTHYLVEKLAANALLTEAVAKEDIVDALVDIAAKEQDVFGDFIANNAQAVGKIAQVLVDVLASGDTFDDDFIIAVADMLEDEMREEDFDFDKFAFVYADADNTTSELAQDADITSVINVPQIVATAEEITKLTQFSVEQGQDLAVLTDSLEALFDVDGSPASQVKLVALDTFNPADASSVLEDVTGDVIDTNELFVGDYSFHLFATELGAKSDPLLVKIAVTSDKAAPMLGDVAAVNTALKALALTEGSTIAANTIVDISGLFTDADTADLTYAIVDAEGTVLVDDSATDGDTIIPGVTFNIDGENLTVEGTPLVGGEFKIFVTATDDVYVPVTAELMVSVAGTSDMSALSGLLEGSNPENDKVYVTGLDGAVAADAAAVAAVAYVDGDYYSDVTAGSSVTYSINGNVISYSDESVDYFAYASAKQAVVFDGTNFDLITATSLGFVATPAVQSWAADAIVDGTEWYLVDGDQVNKYEFLIAADATKTKTVVITPDVFGANPVENTPITWALDPSADTESVKAAIQISNSTPNVINNFSLLIDDGKLISVLNHYTDAENSNTDEETVLNLLTTDAELAKRLAAIAPAP